MWWLCNRLPRSFYNSRYKALCTSALCSYHRSLLTIGSVWKHPYTCVYFKSEFVDVYYLSFNIGTKSYSQFVCHDDLNQVHWRTLILCAYALCDWICSFGMFQVACVYGGVGSI